MPRLPRSFFTIAAIVAFLALGFGLFCSTGHDDSHITYWAAESLRRFGQIVNYNGDRVEQSSSLFHVVLLAILSAVTRVQLPTLGPITSILGGVAAIAVTARLARLAAPDAPQGAPLLVATAESVIHWGFGGLETTLVSALAAWFVYEVARYHDDPSGRRLARAAAATLLYAASRPESPLVIGCVIAVALALAGYRRYRFQAAGSYAAALRRPMNLALCAAASAAVLFGFRRAYFGAYFPNPVYSKVPGLAVFDGISYLATSLFPGALWIIPGVYYGVRHALRRALTDPEAPVAAALSAAFAVAYLAFILLVGGDWMRAGRFLAHAFPLLAVVSVIGATARLKQARWARLAIAVAVLMNLGGTLDLAFSESNGRPVWTTPGLRAQVEERTGHRGYSWFELSNVVHLRDTTVTAEMIDLLRVIREKAPDRKVVIMSTQAGMVPYHAALSNYGSFRFLDVCSLSTRDFIACPTAKQLLDGSRFGLTLSYETYFGNAARLASACGTPRPDIIFSVVPRRDLPIVKRNGYVIYYEQRGPIRGERSRERTTADAFLSDQFIAVDAQLLKQIGLTAKERYTWSIR